MPSLEPTTANDWPLRQETSYTPYCFMWNYPALRKITTFTSTFISCNAKYNSIASFTSVFPPPLDFSLPPCHLSHLDFYSLYFSSCFSLHAVLKLCSSGSHDASQSHLSRGHFTSDTVLLTRTHTHSHTLLCVRYKVCVRSQFGFSWQHIHIEKHCACVCVFVCTLESSGVLSWNSGVSNPLSSSPAETHAHKICTHTYTLTCQESL